MLDYYVKYKIITVIPIEKSVYFYTKLPSDIKLSNELITLNYISKSPFISTSIFSYKKEKNLSIWFTIKEKPSSIFTIPESFIAYFILAELGDGLYRLFIKDNKQLILYIKDGILVIEFLLTNISQLELIESQYHIKTQDISYAQYQKKYNEIWKNPKFLLELRHFSSINLSKNKLLEFFNQYLYYPILFIIFLYIGISSYQSYIMQKEINTLSEVYHTLKKKNIKLKYAIREHNQKVKQLNRFAKKELSSPDPIKILSSLNKVIYKGEDAKIKILTISPHLMKIHIQTKADAIKYFRRLNNLNYFQNISIESTHKYKNGEKIYIYSLLLKVIN